MRLKQVLNLPDSIESHEHPFISQLKNVTSIRRNFFIATHVLFYNNKSKKYQKSRGNRGAMVIIPSGMKVFRSQNIEDSKNYMNIYYRLYYWRGTMPVPSSDFWYWRGTDAISAWILEQYWLDPYNDNSYRNSQPVLVWYLKVVLVQYYQPALAQYWLNP